jgi:hypothetical protein
MVIASVYSQSWIAALLAQERAQPLLERLDPPQRTIVIMAVLGLVLTGLMLVAGTMIGAHWVRRMARQKPRSNQSSSDSWSSFVDRRLRESLEDVLPKVEPGTTVLIDPSSKETKVDRSSPPGDKP